ncbi:NHL repeat protein,D-glucuronyl C5-epimerase,gluconolactonase family protein [Schinkia azotoformans MEV2011]|uniref:NHL repeat protein,D-glucuronyl C5-epimerase,gluconolactonase family protein n=1 Tax=Schinkia azotoformans MEV2011 TaxID=1348973 RepID=A0A072NME5_SCHAZ|nr:NHL repeat-containing protein [Schinkia azotoformans]KEF38849.1 NHL repeat protein,D-glucuronyl C5-epimerase,gluconolactonase family protein [Schinkia azotoformans MEV2011]MEC1696753.1 NHL repeat-containing protein [Schinkia azotoformans]MEC1725038.1 NHL repeat-containing protein [Schinkia azotoformans]MEC1772291.1 NHL repeat-containing protein [Schinkia azotoformans]MEC1781352.1 NHL repeat-containing protein [Schinkia azotoformans]
MGGEKGFVLTSDKIFNPNAFSIAEEGLYLADLNTGIQLVTMKGVSSLDIKETEFRLPAALALFNGKLYICDYRNNRIVVLDKRGKYVDEWSNKEMSDPEGIAIDENGNVYIASYGNGKILKFDATGKLINSWTNASIDGNVQLKHPHGIYISNNNVFVTELFGDVSVIQYNLEGEFIKKFGNEDANWKLKYPTSLWVHEGEVFVADAVSNRITVFDINGKFVRSFGELGIGDGQFFYPYGVGVDEKDIIYVGDTHNNRIQFFSLNGDYLGSINNPKMIGEKSKTINKINQGDQPKELKFSSEEIKLDDSYGISVGIDKLFTTDLNGGSINSISKNVTPNNMINGLIYPWSVKNEKENLWVLDEPGGLSLYSKESSLNLYYNITSLQFDPTESVNTWIYRPQDISIIGDQIAIANTVPGNVVILNRYGGIEKEIGLVGENQDKAMPTGIEFVNKNELIVVDMHGTVKMNNLANEYSMELKTPIGFYQPYRVNINKVNGLIGITEPYANRIQFFDKDYNWVGYISDKSNSLINKPVGITSDNDGEFYVSNIESDVLLKINVENYQQNNNRVVMEREISSFDIKSRPKSNIPSPFIKVYDAPTNKALDYWSYYKDDKGIVKYDFGFSWLNFKVPVNPGYGNHSWPTGIAHYSLLNYYKWKETNENKYKEEFLIHVNWLLENGVKKSNGVIVWPNEVKLNLKNVQVGYISASAQAGAAAVLMKAIEVNPENKKVYLDYAHGALKAFEYSTEENGVRSSLNGEPFFIEYPGEDIERVDILPFMWTLVFLKEAGQSGEPYYIAGKETAEIELAKNKVLIGGFPYWGEQFNQTGIDLQTSKTVVKILDALNINIK